jgi:hypothetical protein
MSFISNESWQNLITKYQADIQKLGEVGTPIIKNYLGITIRRMKSFFLHPLGPAHYFIFPIIFFFIALLRKYTIMKSRLWIFAFFIFLAFSQLLTVGRGAILSTYCSLFIGLWLVSRHKVTKWGITLIGLFTFSIAMISSNIIRTVFISSVLFRDSSSATHLRALIHGLQTVLYNPLGIGLGHGGHWAIKIGGEAVKGIRENFFFVVGGQIGLLGLLFFIVFFIKMFKYQFDGAKWFLDRSFHQIFLFSIGLTGIAYFLASIWSEPLLRFTQGTYWILAGISIQLLCRANFHHNKPKGANFNGKYNKNRLQNFS